MTSLPTVGQIWPQGYIEDFGSGVETPSFSLLSPSIVYSSSGTVSGAFDQDVNTKWVSNTSTLPVSVDLSYSTPVIIKQLGFTTADEPSGGDPLAISIQGRNSVDASWENISTNNYLNPPLDRYTDYPLLTIPNNNQYYYYRLLFPSVRTEESIFQISEIKVYGDVGAIPPSPDPYFENVSLLLLMEADLQDLENGIYIFNDSSINNLQLVREGNARPSTEYKKFGLTGGRFYSPQDQLRLPTDAILDMGTEDFTVEGWIYYSNSNGVQTKYVFQTGGVGNSVLTLYSTDYGRSLTLSWDTDEIRGGIEVSSVWNHFAVTRLDGEITLHVNGVKYGPKTMTDSISFSQAVIAGGYSGTLSGFDFIDEFRITQNIARYTTNFIPPTSSFANAHGVVPTYKDPYFSDVSLLLPLTGLDGETAFEDRSLNNLVVTNGGDVEVSEIFRRFSDPTALFPGTSTSYLSVPAGDGFNFENGDFTIEAWVNPNSTLYIPIYCQTSDFGSDNNTFKFGYWGGNWNVFIKSNTEIVNFSVPDTVSTGEFFHIALCREGNVFRVLKNGVSLSLRTLSVSLPNLSGPVYIGTCRVSTTQRYLSGSVDEVRVTKGVCRPYGVRPEAPFSSGILTNFSQLTNQHNVLFQYSILGSDRDITQDPLAYDSIDFSMYANHFASITSIGYAPGESPTRSTGFSITHNGELRNNIRSYGVYTFECYFKLISPTENSAKPLFFGTEGKKAVVGIYNGGPYMETEGVNGSTFVTKGPVVPGIWYHLVVCRDGANVVRVFLDGTLYIEFVDSDPHQYDSFSIGHGFDQIRFIEGEALYTSEFNRPTIHLPSITETQPLGDPHFSDVSLLLLMDGQVDNFLFPDRSSFGRATDTNGYVGGPPFTRTFARRFWPSGAHFDDGGGINIANTDGGMTLDGDFTIEMWIKTSNATLRGLFGDYQEIGAGDHRFTLNGTHLQSVYKGLGVAIDGVSYVSGINKVSDDWTFLSYTRSGNQLFAHADGNLLLTATTTTTFNILSIGATMNSPEYIGYMGPVRVTKGVARYTNSSYIPTAVPFPDFQSPTPPSPGYRFWKFDELTMTGGVIEVGEWALSDGTTYLSGNTWTTTDFIFDVPNGSYTSSAFTDGVLNVRAFQLVSPPSSGSLVYDAGEPINPPGWTYTSWFQPASRYITGVRVSVSNDGTNYTPYAIFSGLNVNGSAGLAYYPFEPYLVTPSP